MIRDARRQFGIATLMKLTTVCCVLAAFTWMIGVGPACFLALFIALLELRFGLLSIFALGGAMLTAEVPAEPSIEAFLRHVWVLALAVTLPLACRLPKTLGQADFVPPSR